MNALSSSFNPAPATLFCPQSPMSINQAQLINEKVNLILRDPNELQVFLPQILQKDLHEATDFFALLIEELVKKNPIEVPQANSCAYDTFLYLPPYVGAIFLKKYPNVFFQLLRNLNLDQRKNLLNKLIGENNLLTEHFEKSQIQIKEYEEQARESSNEKYSDLMSCVSNVKAQIQNVPAEFDHWRNLFVGVFQSLGRVGDKDPQQDFPAAEFMFLILEALSERRKKRFLKTCANAMSVDDFSFILVRLGEQDCDYACEMFRKHHPLDMSREGFFSFFEALSKQDNFRFQVNSIMSKLLAKFCQKNKFNLIQNSFYQLNFTTQVALLDAMDPTRRQQIFDHFKKDYFTLASWLNGLFLYRYDYAGRDQFIKQVMDSVKPKNLLNFFNSLDVLNSNVGSYLLASLTDNCFDSFSIGLSPEIRTKLMYDGVIDSTILEALTNMSEPRQSQIFEVSGFKLKESIVQDNPQAVNTLRSCFELMMAASNDSSIAENYKSFISQIPPILMGVLTLSAEKKSVVMKLTPFFNESQLRCISFLLPAEEHSNFLKDVLPSLSDDEYLRLLQQMSPSRLVPYIALKTGHMRAAYREFVHIDGELQKALKATIPDQKITEYSYNVMENQLTKLIAIVNQPSLTEYRIFSTFLNHPYVANLFSPDEFRETQLNIQDFNRLMSDLNQKRPLFEGPKAPIRNQLNALSVIKGEEKEFNGKEVDLVETLPVWFWGLIHEWTLPYLGISPHITSKESIGISHAGELAYLGIQREQDLINLGVTLECSIQVDRLINGVLKLQTGTPLSIPSSPKKRKTENEEDNVTIQGRQGRLLWSQCVDIKLGKEEVKQLCEQIVLSLKVDKHNVQELKTGCLEFYRGLLKFPLLTQKEEMEARIITLEGTTNPERIVKDAPKLLYQGLITLRGFSPLIALQSYLKSNSHIKATWESLHAQNIYSISALLESGKVKQSDLLQLEKFVTKKDVLEEGKRE